MKKGTIVHIDYDLYNADTELLLETTSEEVAKEHDIHDERRTYKPMITVIGEMVGSSRDSRSTLRGPRRKRNTLSTLSPRMLMATGMGT